MSIELIIGPMYASKSSELFKRLRRFQYAKKKCILVKYALDDRYSKEYASTHDKITMEAVPTEKLYTIKSLVIDHDVIGIDEGQFYPDLVEFSEEMANLGKIVIIAALDSTFQRKPFGHVIELIPLAESVVKLSAICVCGKEAAFSKRITAETDVEIIGGVDKYIAVCRKCF